MIVITTSAAVAKTLQKDGQHAAPAEHREAWESAHVTQLAKHPEVLIAKPVLGAGVPVPLVRSPETALCAESCVLAYRPASEIHACLQTAGFSDIATWRRPDSLDARYREPQADMRPVRAFGFCDSRRAFVAFRGSQSFADWGYNFSAWLTGFPSRHAGFDRGWNEIAPDVRAWLDRVMKGREALCLTGHSLGGALATLAALELGRAHPVRRVVTLGSPCVGMGTFVTVYRACRTGPDGATLDELTERYQHGVDIVAAALPPEFFFAHVSPRVQLPPCTIDEMESSVFTRPVTAGGPQVAVRVLRADRSFELVPGTSVMSNLEQFVLAIGPIVALLLSKLGLNFLLPFAHKLGPLGMRVYHGGMHHRSAVYATLLSPTRILGDWLNRPPVSEGQGGWLAWIAIALVIAGLITAYLLGGRSYVLWALGAIALAFPLAAVLYVNFRR